MGVDGGNAGIKMFQRIETISNDVRRILKIVDTIKGEPVGEKETYKFDDPEFVNDFRILNNKKAKEQELVLDLRQLLLFKKANDIGTEKVVLQTIIGIDGDVTTRIAHSFADKPIEFINKTHNEAIGVSVKFWESLVTVVVKLGESIVKYISNKI